MTSTNGIVWESVINDLGGCRDIVWSGGKFVIAHFALPGFSTSTDGKSWNNTAFQTSGGYICITYSPDLNIFVSVNKDGDVVKSIDDGLTWASITTPPNANFPKSIVWSSELNIFVIVYRTGTERVAYSSNGDDWFNVIVSLNEWNDIAWSPQLELFVAVAGTGDNRVMTSTDGIIWTDGTIPLRLWESVEWSELGFFIATAKDGFILYSNDGLIWTESILSGSLYGGCWSKEIGIFVIVGLDIIHTSSLKNRKPTNENIFNNEFNSIDEDGTWSFNSLNTNSILLNGSSVSTLIGDKQDKLQAGTNISIDALTSEISCDLTAGENINITTDGVISSTGGTTLTGGTNITIEGGAVSCDLSAGTNIDITGGVISSTGGGTTLTGGTNITIEGGAVSCDLTAGTNISIDAFTSEISCDLSAGTNINITDGVISSTGGGTTIDNTTELDVLSLKTDDLIVNDIVNTDTREFNTIVIRRPNQTYGGADPSILIRELQCWVNDINILVANSIDLVSYFASFLNNSVPIDPPELNRPASNAYNNDITGNLDTGSPGDDVNIAIIIKNIPLTFVKDIQSLVFYMRFESVASARTLGLGIELYNTNDDPNLQTALEATSVITNAFQIFRYDFGYRR